MHRIVSYGTTIVITAAVLFSCRDLRDLDTRYLNDLDPTRNTRESLRVLETSLRTPVTMVMGSILCFFLSLQVIDDPCGNSFVESTEAPSVDPQLTVEYYTRTQEQDLQLGIQQVCEVV